LALTVSTMTSRSPAATVVGVVTLGVVTLPWFTAPPLYATVLASGAPTTTLETDVVPVPPLSSVTTSVTV
jgi:hypothetical protein